jgi:membrane protease YdiL (CAAX protease family)
LSDGTWEHRAARAGAGVEIAAFALVPGYGVLVDRAIPDAAYVPANLAAAALALLMASRVGVSASEMGLDKAGLERGLETGLYSLAPIAAAVALAVAVPWTREFFLDSEVVGATGGRALYEMLVRIPLGTALAEELIFRGALMGLFLERRGPAAAVALSSAAFGLWHISPTLKSLATNPAAGSAASGPAATTGIVAGVVLVTAAAGAALAWLRLRSGSLAAPWLVHTGLNSFSYMAGRVVAGIGK